jgi:hypothetical protein
MSSLLPDFDGISVKEREIPTQTAVLPPLQWVPVSTPTGRLRKRDRERVWKHVANNRSRLKSAKRTHQDHRMNRKSVLAVRPKAPVRAIQSRSSLKDFEYRRLPNWWYPSNLRGPSNVPELVFHR